MRILYVSVHSVLEDDEIRMLKRLGHDVFPLGVNFGFTAIEPFRESIAFNTEEHRLLDQFHAMGCVFRYGPMHAAETMLTADFIALFDVVIVMHDLAFIERFWPILSQRPVIWRTIGQNLDGWVEEAAEMQRRGLHIVRYSPVERLAPSYCGETALIRFGKDSAECGPWLGHARQILTFANLLVQRYPDDAAIYAAITDGLPSALGGVANDSLQGAIGLLTPDEQKARYCSSRAYFYCSGRKVPYTLNFIEALMTGIPVVAFKFDPPSRYYEVPALLEGAGIVVSDIAEAREVLSRLLTNKAFAREIGERGRIRAIELFGWDTIGRQWDELLSSIVA